MIAAAIGVQQEEICRMLNISGKTLRRTYSAELARGLTDANVKVARRLFEMATEGEARVALPAAIFWLKTRGGFRESGHGVNLSVMQQQAAPIMRVPMPLTPEDWDKAAASYHEVQRLAQPTIAASGPQDAAVERKPSREAVDSLEEPGARPRRRAMCTPLWYAQRRR